MKSPLEARSTTQQMLESIDRSLRLIVKLMLRENNADQTLTDRILLLHSLGCRPIEIAEMLGKNPSDVNPVISRARSGTRPSGAQKRAREQ